MEETFPSHKSAASYDEVLIPPPPPPPLSYAVDFSLVDTIFRILMSVISSQEIKWIVVPEGRWGGMVGLNSRSAGRGCL